MLGHCLPAFRLAALACRAGVSSASRPLIPPLPAASPPLPRPGSPYPLLGVMLGHYLPAFRLAAPAHRAGVSSASRPFFLSESPPLYRTNLYFYLRQYIHITGFCSYDRSPPTKVLS
ncbi:hypothetical protein B0H19DRAFT_1134160 [Mycena capillaripes]|nr:hypothetical protein B0H19DRAFT_1134160 [Mycena capillaripes]